MHFGMVQCISDGRCMVSKYTPGYTNISKFIWIYLSFALCCDYSIPKQINNYIQTGEWSVLGGAQERKTQHETTPPVTSPRMFCSKEETAEGQVMRISSYEAKQPSRKLIHSLRHIMLPLSPAAASSLPTSSLLSPLSSLLSPFLLPPPLSPLLPHITKKRPKYNFFLSFSYHFLTIFLPFSYHFLTISCHFPIKSLSLSKNFLITFS